MTIQKELIMEAEKTSSHHSFSIGEAIKYGWAVTTKNLKFLILVVLMIFAASFIIEFVKGFFEPTRTQNTDITSILIAFILQIIGTIVGLLFTVGFIRIALKLVDGVRPMFQDLYDNWNKTLWHYFVGSLLYGFIVFVGLLLFIIPGIYFAVKYQFFMYFIIDKGMGPVEAIKASGKATKGNKWRLIGLGLVNFGIMLIGVALLFIGLLFAYPLCMVAHVYAYRKLIGGKIAVPSPVTKKAPAPVAA